MYFIVAQASSFYIISPHFDTILYLCTPRYLIATSLDVILKYVKGIHYK